MSVPLRQIRAVYDDETITVYQAYSADIAGPAVEQQRLSASPKFLPRMTWIKPSWCWMMYRSGYSYKDPGQERILALRMRRASFHGILKSAVLSHGVEGATASEKARVQWDPERNSRLERLDYRSIQIGIPKAMCQEWIDNGIVSIEDVTERARELKRVLDEEADLEGEALIRRGLLPEEKEYVLPADVAQIVEVTGSV